MLPASHRSGPGGSLIALSDFRHLEQRDRRLSFSAAGETTTQGAKFVAQGKRRQASLLPDG